MMSLVLIHPAPDAGWAGQRLDGVLRHALAGREVQVVRRAEELSGLEGRRLLLALALGDAGVNLEYVRGCQDGQVLLSQGERIPVSRLRERELTQALLRYMKERGI